MKNTYLQHIFIARTKKNHYLCKQIAETFKQRSVKHLNGEALNIETVCILLT